MIVIAAIATCRDRKRAGARNELPVCTFNVVRTMASHHEAGRWAIAIRPPRRNVSNIPARPPQRHRDLCGNPEALGDR